MNSAERWTSHNKEMFKWVIIVSVVKEEAEQNEKLLYSSQSEHFVRNGVHKQHFFWKHQFALINWKILLKTNKINSLKLNHLGFFLDII